MRVFRNKLTGRLGETQFGEDADVLIRNAKASGFKDEEIEIVDTTPKEYKEAINLQNIADRKPEQDKIDVLKSSIGMKLSTLLTEEEINFLLK